MAFQSDPGSAAASVPVGTSHRVAPSAAPLGRASGARQVLLAAAPGMVALAVLALYGLTYKDAWNDEVASIASTTQPRLVLKQTAGTMAAYYAALNGWIRLSDSLWWLRFLSVLFAVAVIVVTAAVARRFRGPTTARWACLALGTSYMLVRYAREARSFTMLLLVVAGGWLALDHVVEGRARRSRWMLLHLCLSGLAPLVHGLGVIAVLAQAAVLLAARVPAAVWKRAGPGLAASLVVVGSLYSLGASDVGAGSKLTYDGARKVLYRLHGGDRWDELTWLDPRHVLLALTAYGLALGGRRWLRAGDPVARFRALAPVVWAVAPIAGLFALAVVRPQLVDRYAIASIPALAIVQADAARHLWGLLVRLVRLPARLAVVPVLPLLLVASFLPGQAELNSHRDRTWSGIVEVLAEHGRDGDGFWSPRSVGRMTVDYAWSQHDGPLPELIPVGPTHPMGMVLRYGTRVDTETALKRASRLDRLWMLEIRTRLGQEDFAAVIDRPSLTWRFKVVNSYEFPSARLYLLERR